MTGLIEIFHSNNPKVPYWAITWRDFRVINIDQYARLVEVAAHCWHSNLPVVCRNERLGAQLRLYNVRLRPFPAKIHLHGASFAPCFAEQAVGESF